MLRGWDGYWGRFQICRLCSGRERVKQRYGDPEADGGIWVHTCEWGGCSDQGKTGLQVSEGQVQTEGDTADKEGDTYR